MQFNSIEFLIFFPIVVIFYFAIPHRKRWIWLLIASYFFYMSWNPEFAVLIAISTVTTYIGGIIIEKANGIHNKKKSIKKKKLHVVLCILINIGILFLFKYYNFFKYIIMMISSYFHITVHIPSLDLLLPVGISFYTFKVISYIIDVYRGDTKAQKNLGKYALYVSFFPQILAGPIEKSKDLLYQFDEKHYFDYERVKNGLLLMLWGIIQKVVISDRLAKLVDVVYKSPDKYSGFEIVIATVFFAFQIYCDFAGYSDIAIGAEEVLGFKASKNFERPYFSKSIKEFWRRWHITLGAWFKDYLYIPMGGNRCSKLKNYFNIMVVFLVCGLWHGAAINYVVWGAIHGLYQIIGNILKPLKRALIKMFNINTNKFGYKLYQVITTFILVDFSWIFFRASSFKSAIKLIKNMFYFNPWIFTNGTIYKLGLDYKELPVAAASIIFILIVNLVQRKKCLRSSLCKRNIILRWCVYITAVVIILIFGIYGPGYSKEQFIYMQF